MTRKKLAAVKDNPDLVRDMSSNAVINTNKSSFENRKAQQKFSKVKENEISELRSQIAEIRELLNKMAGEK
jgi:hypothetical protein